MTSSRRTSRGPVPGRAPAVQKHCSNTPVFFSQTRRRHVSKQQITLHFWDWTVFKWPPATERNTVRSQCKLCGSLEWVSLMVKAKSALPSPTFHIVRVLPSVRTDLQTHFPINRLGKVSFWGVSVCKTAFFWVVTTCILIELYQHFRCTFCLHFQCKGPFKRTCLWRHK